jgi:hypothetical protein
VTPPARCYRLFGLRVASEIELPELFEAGLDAGDGLVDVTIVRGAVAAAGPDAVDGVVVAGDGATLEVPDVARFHVVGGKTITVGALPGAPEANVRLFLLGSASAILIYQRGLLPLHANAIEIDGRAVAFLGESGAGKSTLAAWFNDRGARILSDDVCVVGFGDGGGEGEVPLAMPGLPRYRLWRDALERSGRDAAHHPRSYFGDDEYDKFDVAVPAAKSTDVPLPVAALYVLEQGKKFAVEPLVGWLSGGHWRARSALAVMPETNPGGPGVPRAATMGRGVDGQGECGAARSRAGARSDNAATLAKDGRVIVVGV